MKRRIFSKTEQEELLRNPNIEKCSDKSITYSTEFKIYTTIEDQSNLSDYYRDQEKVYILVQPIVTLGNLTKIKEARLIKILKTKGA